MNTFIWLLISSLCLNIVYNIGEQPLGFGLGRVPCFGQWDVSRCDAGKGFQYVWLSLPSVLLPTSWKEDALSGLLVAEEWETHGVNLSQTHGLEPSLAQPNQGRQSHSCQATDMSENGFCLKPPSLGWFIMQQYYGIDDWHTLPFSCCVTFYMSCSSLGLNFVKFCMKELTTEWFLRSLPILRIWIPKQGFVVRGEEGVPEWKVNTQMQRRLCK